jgi:peptidoglycan/xylan/chitin deacetylase (PgdA/CDA1 family)
MKKRFLYLLLSTVMLLGIVGCNGDVEVSPQDRVPGSENGGENLPNDENGDEDEFTLPDDYVLLPENVGIAWSRIFSASEGNTDWESGFNHENSPYIEFDVTVPGRHTITLPEWPRSDNLWVGDNTGAFFLMPANPSSPALSVTIDSIAINGTAKTTNQRLGPSAHGFWNETAGTFFGNIELAGGVMISSIPGFEILHFQVPVGPGPAIDQWSSAGESALLGAINEGDIVTITFLVGTPPESAPIDLPTRARDPQLSDFPEGTKFIALTFDDGPNTNYTVQVLDELARLGATATFYVNPVKFNDATIAVVHRMITEGHDVDSHGWAHTSFGADTAGTGITFTTQEEAIADLTKASEEIFRVTGYWPFSFRAPFFQWGGNNDILLGLDVMFNMPFVGSGMDTNDWQASRTPQIIADFVLDTENPSGGIILLHDCGDPRQRTVDSLALFIPEMQARGYQFVSVRQLMMLTQTTPELFTGKNMWPNANAWVPARNDWADPIPLWPDNPDWWNENWWTDPTPPWER